MTMPPDSQALFASLVGPLVSVGDAKALGGVIAEYETEFARFADIRWGSDGAAWDQANYYDRAKIYYVWWARTGNQEYLDRANQLAVDYRENYLVASDYGASAHWSQITGVALHYLVTGDEGSRTAVGRMADDFSYPYYTDNLHNLDAEMDNRVQGRVIESLLLAHELDAPTENGNDWAVVLREALSDILASQTSDGGYPFAVQGGATKPFMVGVLNDALIDYYTRFEADPRILTAVKKSLDYLWEHTWRPEDQAFEYQEGDGGGAADLNGLIVSGFGWVYHMTGDETYKTRGDMVFAGGVEGAWLQGSKQFNQEYTTSYKYLAYTHPDLAHLPDTQHPSPPPVVQPPAGPDLEPAGALALNAGGAAASVGGASYMADQYFSGGETYKVSAAIVNTTDDALYQSERYGAKFGYALPVENGTYSVTLKFAEIWFDAPGQRVFDVTAEGKVVIDDLDIWAAAGDQYVAKDIVVPVNVTDGTLNLEFISSVENAKVSAIRVDPISQNSAVVVNSSAGTTAVMEGGATDSFTVHLAKQPSANVVMTIDGTADVTVGTGASPSGPATLTFTRENWDKPQQVTVAAMNDALAEGPEAASVSFSLASDDPSYDGLSVAPVSVSVIDSGPAKAAIAVNAGGPGLSVGGTSYVGDQYLSGGETYKVSSAIANTTDDALYQTERYGTDFGYALPVENGTYSVTLKFAEIWFDAPGQRVFDVTAEGKVVIDDLDIWAAAGDQYVAKDIVVPVNVTDGTLNLQFISSVENAKISAIRVDRLPSDTGFDFSRLGSDLRSAGGSESIKALQQTLSQSERDLGVSPVYGAHDELIGDLDDLSSVASIVTPEEWRI